MNILESSLITWAKARPEISGILLVGSHARGDFRPDSDVDLVILSSHKSRLVEDRVWTENFGKIESQSKEDWGAVISLRTKYIDGLEVEFGITGPEWASLDPVDQGTSQVLRGGAKIIWDPANILGHLLERRRSVMNSGWTMTRKEIETPIEDEY